MSRSIKRHPVQGICGGSDTDARRKAGRVLRHRAAHALRTLADPDGATFPLPAEVETEWDWPSDGRRYVPARERGGRPLRK